MLYVHVTNGATPCRPAGAADQIAVIRGQCPVIGAGRRLRSFGTFVRRGGDRR